VLGAGSTGSGKVREAKSIEAIKRKLSLTPIMAVLVVGEEQGVGVT